MPKRDVCVYSGCSRSRRKFPDVTFHRFPQEESIRLQWIDRSGNAALAQLTVKQMSNVRICCTHFAQSDIVSYGGKGKVTIKRGALPIDIATVVQQVDKKTTLEIDDVAPEDIAIATPIPPPLITKRKYKKLNPENFTPMERRLQRLVTLLRKEIVKRNQTIRRLKASLMKRKIEILELVKESKAARKSHL